MNYFKNTTVRTRLLCIFVGWMLVFSSFGLFVAYQMNQLVNVTKKIYEDPLQVSNASMEVRTDLIKMYTIVGNIVNSVNELDFQHWILEASISEQRIYTNLDIIKKHTTTTAAQEYEKETRKLYREWSNKRAEITKLISKGNRKEAFQISQENDPRYLDQLVCDLIELDSITKDTATKLVSQSTQIQNNQRNTLITLMISISIISFMLFYVVIKSILDPIAALKNAMHTSTNTDQLVESDLEGNNEIVDMANHYNSLIKRLKRQFWITNGKNSLNEALSGDINLEQLTQKAINFLSRTLHAGKGVFYIYNDKTKNLELKAAFSFTQKGEFKKQYPIGHGIIGQVALEKEPILLSNIQNSELLIETGTLSQVPLNTYTFPLLYEEKVYGVIELAAFELFDKNKQEFINEFGKIVSINLYSTIQKEKIKSLLEYSEKQQLLLEQQAKDLTDSNVQLEEQQSQLEEQARLLETKNQDLEQSKEELTSYSLKLEATNKYKSQFLANMSHELRTPLNSIILLSKLLSENPTDQLSKKNLEKVNIIYKAGNDLLQLINDILDLSKIESGKVDLLSHEFHSNELVIEMKQLFERLAKEKNIKLYIEDLVNTQLIGDKDKISQVLKNLISNAIKFTHEGSVTFKMTPNKQNGVTFYVSDTGIGIPKDKLPIIFEEFQQVDGSISRKYGGTGLGLSICKKISEIMNGNIHVSSEEGIGSNFSFFLPNIISELEAAHTEVSSSKEVDLICDRNKKILMIEDDENFANVIKKINEDMGFDTLIAKTGKEGLQFVQKYKFDGILLDLGLPDMSGIEVLRELKSIRELSTIPVHIISGIDKDASIKELGAIGYHQKPISEKDISNVLTNMISFSKKTPKYLLVVEDDPVQRRAIKELVQNTEIEVSDVATEQEAVQELKRNIYDVIILDLDLKEGSGMNVCKFIEEKNMNIPIIIYTGKDLTSDQQAELKKYASRIILKTNNSDEKLLDDVALFLHKVRINKKENYLLPAMQQNHVLDLESKKILVVDDDPRNIFVLAAALENYGVVIYEADNGKTALEKLHEEKVDLVLMDIMMPVMDGYEAIEKIRKDPTLKHIPIIALTAKALKEDRDKCIEAGADDYISKPVDYNALIQLVNAWIHKYN